ncbi:MULTISPECIES: hypothetical protein [Caproicibacterium]|uniref:Uncharacterized protein n=1 Tax=Caproicibacterium lactatifermentans TaxID=2666138 RepID=A0ABX6PVI3_9FIRM|nr:hypothetical protein [Caproicibacterium lactatifermentans]MDD4806887.1 hypothetical protein [Oscillospiraceae bacterium]QKO30315.1 hypothetical protein GKP14_04370 [Caproicibacterium lactatifermentans]
MIRELSQPFSILSLKHVGESQHYHLLVQKAARRKESLSVGSFVYTK